MESRGTKVWTRPRMACYSSGDEADPPRDLRLQQARDGKGVVGEDDRIERWNS